jgi:hypothetical protein
VTLTPDAARVIRAVARAAHRAGWDEAHPAMRVAIPGDGKAWSDLATRRSEGVVEALRSEGVAAIIDSSAEGLVLEATPEALRVSPTVPRR